MSHSSNIFTLLLVLEKWINYCMKGTELNSILTHFHITSWNNGVKMKEAELVGSPMPTRDIDFMLRANQFRMIHLIWISMRIIIDNNGNGGYTHELLESGQWDGNDTYWSENSLPWEFRQCCAVTAVLFATCYIQSQNIPLSQRHGQKKPCEPQSLTVL